MAERKYTAVERTDTCLNCGNLFTYSYTCGKRKVICSDVCRKEQHAKQTAIRKSKCFQCSVEGCINLATRKSTGLCETHYYRLKRTGLLSKKPAVGRYVTGAGYIKLLLPNHPLADNGGNVFEHRVVAYEKHAGVCPDCHWCGTTLEWPLAVVDHLNENKADNEASNLVVACNDCNRSRGALLPMLARMRPSTIDQFLRIAREYHQRIQRKC